MAHIPTTSETLLRDISCDSQHARWGEFSARYRPMMEAYLRENYPHQEADDIIQETLIALVAKLPSYRYVPNETGHFHNYLTGILRRKALRACASAKRRLEVMEDYRNQPEAGQDGIKEAEEKKWRDSVYEIALQQLLADDGVQGRTKQIFLRAAVNGEKPEEVAEAFGITRNSVDQIKSRLIDKLREVIEQLESVDEVAS